MADIVILTGAGISAESGLGTFRDKDGLWTRFDLSKVATPEGFIENPALVHEFYNARRANARESSPNAAHFALAEFEKRKSGDILIVTQNVDDLHERAGSRNVLHMHGQLSQALCAACRATWTAPLVMTPEDRCPDCDAPSTRPDIVWFGEIPYHMEMIEDALSDCGLFAAIGTSGQVWPAAGFVEAARMAGAHCIELNLERSDVSERFDEVRLGRATDIVPSWVSGLV